MNARDEQGPIVSQSPRDLVLSGGIGMSTTIGGIGLDATAEFDRGVLSKIYVNPIIPGGHVKIDADVTVRNANCSVGLAYKQSNWSGHASMLVSLDANNNFSMAAEVAFFPCARVGQTVFDLSMQSIAMIKPNAQPFVTIFRPLSHQPGNRQESIYEVIPYGNAPNQQTRDDLDGFTGRMIACGQDNHSNACVLRLFFI
jgi:hypothetical protein